MIRPAAALSGLVALAVGCGNLQGVGGPVMPLVTFPIEATGNLTAATSLQVALVWGAQWWTEPFCIAPPESAAAAAVIAAGCRDPFGFVPNQVGASVPVVLDQPTTLSLNALPTADLLVGGVTSRVGYASFVLYDDRDGTTTLNLSSPHAAPTGGRGRPDQQPADSSDVIYGASFVTMTAPDVRASFIEGTYLLSAFYPRKGCQDETDGFAIEGAGGFSAADALAASAAGTIPSEDRSTCSHSKQPNLAMVTVAAAQDPASVAEVGCAEPTLDGSVRYRQPPANPPDLNDRVSACVHLPSLGGTQSDPTVIQLVVSGRATDRCKGLTHYTLRGCREDVACAVPDWDFTADPPSWWPCPN